MSGWAVYTRITASEQTKIQFFDDLVEAERFVENRRNWQSPVPLVSVCQPSAAAFSGPILRTWLKIDRNEDPTKLSFEEYCDRVFRDIALDGAAPVMQKLEQQGLLQPGDPSAPFGASRITPAELKVILNRIGELALPEVHCSLGLDWDFITLKLNAEHLGGHVQLLPSGLNLCSLAEVVFDLEDALRSRFTGLTIVDIFNFWTSVEVHDHIAEVCRRSVDAMDWHDLERIREEMARRLGSYAHTVRSVAGVQPAISRTARMKKPGSPTKIPDELKVKAVGVRRGRARTQTLNQTNYPNTQPMKNVSAAEAAENESKAPHPEAATLPDDDQAQRAQTRSEWLNQKLVDNRWTADTDIAANGGPTYNTIRRYRSGKRSTRDSYVRLALSKAFRSEFSDVPE